MYSINVKKWVYNFVYLFSLIVTGDKKKREDVDSDLDQFSEEHLLGNSDNISPSLPKKQKGKCFIVACVLKYCRF